MSQSGFLYSIPIRILSYLISANTESRSNTLTNIFLDNTAALRKKKYLHPSCSLMFFFFFFWNKVYTFIWLFVIVHMLLQLWPTTLFALAGETVTLHCDSRPSSTASCMCATQPMLDTSVSSIAFFIFLTLSRKMMWTHCLSLSHAFSISLITCFAYYMFCILYETHESIVYTGTLWFESGVNVMLCRDHRAYIIGDSKTPGNKENPDPLPCRWAGYPEQWIQLPSL